jgi:hypothetical protein
MNNMGNSERTIGITENGLFLNNMCYATNDVTPYLLEQIWIRRT